MVDDIRLHLERVADDCPCEGTPDPPDALVLFCVLGTGLVL